SSVESTLAWTSLRPYRLFQAPLTSVIDVDDETHSVGLHADPWCASVYIPPILRNTHAASSRGALDDRAEMTYLIGRFLKYIHAKQPIVDPDILYGQISVVEEEGLGWDERTCLLVTRIAQNDKHSTNTSEQLIACALGGICMPYD